MSTIIIIGGGQQQAHKTAEQEQNAKDQLVQDAEALRAAGYEVQIYNTTK